MVKLIYPDAEYQFRSAWLERQSLDIFIPSIYTAIEYQGEQHYSAVPVFGGEENLKNNIARDKAKREKCANNGIRLIEWSHSERASVQNVLKELSCAGVENVPTVSDIGSMISEKNMKTVRKEIYEEYNNRVIIAK